MDIITRFIIILFVFALAFITFVISLTIIHFVRKITDWNKDTVWGLIGKGKSKDPGFRCRYKSDQERPEHNFECE